jgi:hypothetical protein
VDRNRNNPAPNHGALPQYKPMTVILTLMTLYFLMEEKWAHAFFSIFFIILWWKL